MPSPAARRAAPDHQRQRATARKRRYRHRLRAGISVYAVEVDGSVLDMLVRLHWLRDSEAADPKEVSRALTALLADAAKS
jgi:hypothetical protein